MSYLPFNSTQSRREFLSYVMLACSAGALKLHARPASPRVQSDPAPELHYAYRTMSVKHFPEMQAYIDGLKRTNRLSWNKTYRSYIDEMSFTLPEEFQDAKSVIVMSVFTRLMRVNFHLNGRAYEVALPPQYYDAGVSTEHLKDLIRKDIVKRPDCRLERTTSLHLKHLAVRSGLGKYGINNLSYVEGMGSYITLYAFLTDYRFSEDHWQEIAVMDACKNCPICYSICPTNCITRENFVIDVGHCITLYNEIDGHFPRFILPSMHNALMGCMKCQVKCPENEKYSRMTGRLEDVSEEETRKILAGLPDRELLDSLRHKLKKFPPGCQKDLFPILTRNLKALHIG